MKQTFIVTGANRGFGLAIAKRLCGSTDCRVILAVRDLGRGEAVAKRLGPMAEARELDLASLADIRHFASTWDGPIAGLVNNAGVQRTTGTKETADGWEETIAVNHLAALALTVQLLPWLEGASVLFIGSATHHPHDRMANVCGFRGARFTNVAALARGEGDARSPEQLGRDRYATSKFLNIATAAELARRVPPTRTAFFTLDPGMMAGTGLARTAPWWQWLLWNTLLRWAGRFLSGASSPARSAVTAVRLLRDPSLRANSGAVYRFDGRLSERVWQPAVASETGQAVIDQSLELLGLQCPLVAL